MESHALSQSAEATLRALGPTLPNVARRAIELWLQRGERFVPENASGPRAGVFVTLRELDGKLRGCVGSIHPVHADAATETARSAVLAATHDPRFAPVGLDELPNLQIEVSVLAPEQRIESASELDPQRFGIVVQDEQGRHGLLLPNVPGVDSATAQLEIARRKAGIPSGAAVVISRFEVHKYEEHRERDTSAESA